jgi:hypothetical protein
MILAMMFACESDSMLGLSSEGTTGQGGSMTRFAINGNYMYLVDQNGVKVFTITSGAFAEIREVPIGFRMETIFARGEYLYLGASDGMYIYSIANPEEPSFIFRYQHIVSCDPVVVQGDRAYVTLRSGGEFCNRGINTLEIIDISDPYAPTLITRHPMSSPHGLAVENTTLFLCEGQNGLKVFDITDEMNIELVTHRDDFFAYDVIARNGVATVTGEDGIFQFSYTGTEINQISKIPVLRNGL